jgi:hypothetical protein
MLGTYRTNFRRVGLCIALAACAVGPLGFRAATRCPWRRHFAGLALSGQSMTVTAQEQSSAGRLLALR